MKQGFKITVISGCKNCEHRKYLHREEYCGNLEEFSTNLAPYIKTDDARHPDCPLLDLDMAIKFLTKLKEQTEGK